MKNKVFRSEQVLTTVCKAFKINKKVKSYHLLVTCILSAFIFGITIGILLPFYVIPSPLVLFGSQACINITRYIKTLDLNILGKQNFETASLIAKPFKFKLTHLRSEVKNINFSVVGGKNSSFKLNMFYKKRFLRLRNSSFQNSDNIIVNNSGNMNNFIPNGEVVIGSYWTDNLESLLPTGFQGKDDISWRFLCQNSAIIKMEEKCGRRQNRMLIFQNGTESCCRYRQNSDQIQGEIFSFHLGRILNIRNIVPSTLSVVNANSWQWNSVRSHLNLAQWEEDKPIVLSKFIHHLVPAYIPYFFRQSNRRLHPTEILLLNLTLRDNLEELIELSQWSDLIVIDYLTANLDRIVNNLYNLQWNPEMMDSPAHNLGKDNETGLLVFFDNESGLLHGYRLLEKYEPYHRTLLNSLCIFRKRTAEIIKKLHIDGNVEYLLKEAFSQGEQHYKNYLPYLPFKNIKTLNSRIETVYKRIMYCESLYPW